MQEEITTLLWAGGDGVRESCASSAMVVVVIELLVVVTSGDKRSLPSAKDVMGPTARKRRKTF